MKNRLNTQRKIIAEYQSKHDKETNPVKRYLLKQRIRFEENKLNKLL